MPRELVRDARTELTSIVYLRVLTCPQADRCRDRAAPARSVENSAEQKAQPIENRLPAAAAAAASDALSGSCCRFLGLLSRTCLDIRQAIRPAGAGNRVALYQAEKVQLAGSSSQDSKCQVTTIVCARTLLDFVMLQVQFNWNVGFGVRQSGLVPRNPPAASVQLRPGAAHE